MGENTIHQSCLPKLSPEEVDEITLMGNADVETIPDSNPPEDCWLCNNSYPKGAGKPKVKASTIIGIAKMLGSF